MFYFHKLNWEIYQIRSDQLLSRVWLFATPWTAARQASLSITNSQSLLKLMSIESVMHSLIPFSSCIQSFPASGSFQMSQLFASDGQNTGVFCSFLLQGNFSTQELNPGLSHMAGRCFTDWAVWGSSIYLSKSTEWTLKVNFIVNCGLWVILMYQCGSLVITNVPSAEEPLSWGGRQGGYGKSPYFPGNFAVNLKLL